MIVITDIDNTTFSIDGVTYKKNFMSVINEDGLRILNVYDSKFILLNWTNYSEIIVNSSAYSSAELLHEALLDVLYFRDTLTPSSGAYWGSILGDISTQTDLINLLSTSAGSTDKETIVLGAQVTTILLDLGDNPKAIELHEGGGYRIEGEFYSYTQGDSVTNSEIAILNGQSISGGTKINILKFY